jgi:hypothetical protein
VLKNGWIKCRDRSDPMEIATVEEAQRRLPELLREAREDTIGLTDADGNLVGLLAGLDEDSIDDFLVQTPGFKAMIARSVESLQSDGTVSLEEVLAEFRAAAARE